MLGNNRRTIGVFVTQQFQEYQDLAGKGICARAAELGYNVAFFTNFLGYGDFQYEVGERNIADLPDYKELDGIILLPDTMYVPKFLDSILKNIRKDCTCPVVSIRQKIEEFYNVLVDDDNVLEDIVKHFIVDHGFRKINFLTGPKDSLPSIKRLNTYKTVLEKYHIPYEENRVYYGDFWKDSPRLAVEQWLKDSQELPDAIICGNDYMAITLATALEESGISVPEDIAISGCDNIFLAKDFYPPLTTVSLPCMDMGMEAVEKIYKHHEGIEQEKDSVLNTSTIIRESCGCKKHYKNSKKAKKRNNFINKIEDLEKDSYHNALMSVELTSITTIDRLDQRLWAYAYMNRGFDNFYMILHKYWDSYTKEDSFIQSDKKEMIMEVGIKKGSRLQKVEFLNSHLLPPSLVDNEPQVFYFNMIHFREVCFGYTAISLKEGVSNKSSYQGWLINVCNSLENIRIHNELNRLVYKLEDISIKDDLTDLYNRRALETLGQKYLQQCIEKQSKLMVFTADMDKLKYINDHYGHSCGDIAIKAAAEALKGSAEDDEICMRVGGDEFVVIGMDYDLDKTNHFIRKFEEAIEAFNRTSKNEFVVNVSYGWSIIKPNLAITLEDCLIIADSRMYQQKYEKESLRLKHRNN